MSENKEFNPIVESTVENHEIISPNPEVIEKSQVLESSRRLGTILSRFRGAIPKKALLLQGLLTAHLSTSEMAHMDSHIDIFRAAYAQNIRESYGYRDKRGREVDINELESAVKSDEGEDADFYIYQLTDLKNQGYNMVLGKSVIVKTRLRNFYEENFIEPAESRANLSDAERAKQNQRTENLMQASTPELFGWAAIRDEGYKGPHELFKHKPFIDQRLSPREDVGLYPLRVRLEQIDPDHNAIWASDYSNPKDPVFFFEILNVNDDNKFKETFARLKEELGRKATDMSLEKIAEVIPTREHRGELLTLVPEQNVTAQRRQDIKDFFAQWDEVEVTLTGVVDFEHESLKLSDDREKITSVVKEQGLPVQAKGSVRITLHRELKKQPIPAGWDQDRLIVGKPEYNIQTDKFGNKIDIRRFQQAEEGLKSTRITENISIEMPGMGITDGSPALIDFNILGHKGLPFLDRSFDRNLIIKQNGYSFIHLDNPQLIKTFSPEVINSITTGVREAEQLFGRKDELVDTVIILNNSENNAYFVRSEETSITFTGQHIKDTSARNVKSTAMHETFHALAYRYKLNESLERAHLTLLGGDFFEKLNEENFYKNHAPDIVGGHSRDNSGEMIASFMNSLNHPDWENEIKRHDQYFLEQYVKLMNEFSNALENIPELRKSPVKKLLADRISLMERMRSKL